MKEIDRNAPKSKRLTKKVGLECLAILDDIEHALFDSRALWRPDMWQTIGLAIGNEGDKNVNTWLQELHDRIIDARTNLWAWKDAEARKAKKQKASRQRKQGRYVITRVAPDGMTRLFLTEFTPVNDGHLITIEDAGWAAIKDVAVEFPSYDSARQIMDGIVAGEESGSKLGKMWAELKHSKED